MNAENVAELSAPRMRLSVFLQSSKQEMLRRSESRSYHAAMGRYVYGSAGFTYK